MNLIVGLLIICTIGALAYYLGHNKGRLAVLEAQLKKF